MDIELRPDLSLNFFGPFHLSGGQSQNIFQTPLVKKSGTYLFGIDTYTSGMVVRYVGQTGVSFEKRLKEHIIQILGGNYRISDVESLKSLAEVTLWHGLWRRGRTGMHQDFIEIYQLNQRERRLIEAALAQHFKSYPNLIASDVRYWSKKPSDYLPVVKVTSTSEITGLPCELNL